VRNSFGLKASCRIRITLYPSRPPASYPFRLLQPKRNPMISTSYGACFRAQGGPVYIGLE
jgi:hypothetical protein